jgi:Flp pilus assembly protein TadB
VKINKEKRMAERDEATKKISPEMEKQVAQRARDRAGNARWDLDVAVFLFAVLIIIIILLFQGIGIEIVAPVAIFGLAMVWLVGWRRGRQLYQRFYDEELKKLENELSKAVKKTVGETIEETIEEKVQKALRERWR